MFSCDQANRLATCFTDNSVFFNVLRHFKLFARKCSRIVTCDMSSPFRFIFARPLPKDKLGFLEINTTISFTSFLVTFPIEPRSGKSSKFFDSFKCCTHYSTNALDFLMYLAAAAYDICGPFGCVQNKNNAPKRFAYAALIAVYVLL